MTRTPRTESPGRGRLGRLVATVRILVREALDDRLTGEAASVAYYFFLSLFPLILALFSLTGILGGQEAFEWVMGHLRRSLPGDAAEYLAEFVAEVTGESRPGLLSFGILFTLWSASNVFAVLTDGLNRMYDLAETRPWWRRRLLAVVALVAASFLLLGGAAAVLAGPELLGLLGLDRIWVYLRWPLSFLMLVAFMWLVYFLLPARDQGRSWRLTLVGAVVGTILWVAGTAGFRLYVSQFGSYSKTYGFVGGIIVLLLWLYLSALAILFGGEVAATLEQLADDDREVGHRRVPGA